MKTPSENETQTIKRWNRTDDKYLWKIVRDVAKDFNLELEEVVDCLTSSENSPFWGKILPTLKEQSKFKNPTDYWRFLPLLNFIFSSSLNTLHAKIRFCTPIKHGKLKFTTGSYLNPPFISSNFCLSKILCPRMVY